MALETVREAAEALAQVPVVDAPSGYKMSSATYADLVVRCRGLDVKTRMSPFFGLAIEIDDNVPVGKVEPLPSQPQPLTFLE